MGYCFAFIQIYIKDQLYEIKSYRYSTHQDNVQYVITFLIVKINVTLVKQEFYNSNNKLLFYKKFITVVYQVRFICHIHKSVIDFLNLIILNIFFSDC